MDLDCMWWNWYLHLRLTTHQHIFRTTTNGPETLPISSMQPISLNGKCIYKSLITICDDPHRSRYLRTSLKWMAGSTKEPSRSYKYLEHLVIDIPSRKLAYPTWGKGKSSTQKRLAKRICQFPGGYIVSGVLYASSRKWNFERIHYRNRPLMGGRATWYSVSTYLSAYLSVYLCIYVSTCLAIYLPVHLFAYLSTHLYIVFDSLSI